MKTSNNAKKNKNNLKLLLESRVSDIIGKVKMYLEFVLGGNTPCA